MDVSAFYRKEGSADWTACSIEGGKAKVKLVGEGTFEIKFRAEKGASWDEEIYKVLVRTTNTLFDFELDDENDTTHYDLGDSQYSCVPSTEWSHDGKYSLKISTTYSGDWAKVIYDTPRTFEDKFKLVTMWIYAPKDIAVVQIYAKSPTGNVTSNKISVAKGEGEYTFEFDKEIQTITDFEFYVTNASYFYVDSVQYQVSALNKTTIQERPLSKYAYLNKEFTFDAPIVSGADDSVDVSYEVVYKQAGDDDYTTLTAKNGNYNVTFTKKGAVEVEIRITLKCQVTSNYQETRVETFTYTVDVIDESSDPAVDDKEWGNS